MQLSKKAIEDLRISLVKDVGLEGIKEFTDEDLDEIGMLLLTILSEALKMKNGIKTKTNK